MPSTHEYLTAQFYKWEQRGRGWQVFEEPVYPEPPFVEFEGHYLPDEAIIDDGRRSTLLSSFVQKLSRTLSTEPAPPSIIPNAQDEPEPTPLIRDSLVEYNASLPEKLDVSREAFEQFLLGLSLCREPLVFELLGSQTKVRAQFAAHLNDAPLMGRQLQAFFPEAVFVPCESSLERAWEIAAGVEMIAVEFGLAREFMLPLASGKIDPFIGIVGALSELEPTELGLFQVLFQPVSQPWPESIVRSVAHADGKSFFVNAPEMASAAEVKVARPLYAAVVRILIRAEGFQRVLQLSRDLAGSLRVFAKPNGNELIPLQNDDYPFVDHIEDVLRRQTRRSGMLLNADELIGFVHLPSTAVRSPAFERQKGKTKSAPPTVQHTKGLVLGNNEHVGKNLVVRLSPEQRVRHCHIIGASGTGKSTLLFNLIQQDIENGEGIAVLDPHGDLVDKVLGTIPPERVDDIVLVDPSDEDYSVGFNILSAHSENEKTLLASDLVSVFQRLSTSWGDQMQSVLQNAILAFLDSRRRGTLADLRRFLIEPVFRTEFLKSVSDPNVLYYWHKGFAHLSGNKSIGPVLTRLEMLLAQRPIAHMVSQSENRLDFGQIIDTGKIFLAKLPEGLLGRENSYLLGALLISKFQQLAMARQAKQIAARRDFWIYIDEFANFITPSMAEILSGARKYRIGLTLAHHELHQLQRSPDVASAVMTHPFTRIVFRIGDDDARKVAEGFSFFEPQDFKNLETGQAIARVERSNFDFNLSIPLPQALDETHAVSRRRQVITASREKYATKRADVEAMLRKTWDSQLPASLVTDSECRTGPIRSERRKDTIPSPTKTIQPGESDRRGSQTRVRDIRPTPPAIIQPSDHKSRTQAPSIPDLGKGGAQHQTVQKRIKEVAESLGFRSTIEKPVPDGNGSIDLLLERSDSTIACEISISTTIDHEIGNIRKCLNAGYSKIVIICLNPERLGKIAAAASETFGTDTATLLFYFRPDEFINYLQGLLPPPTRAADAVKVRRGYQVTRTIASLSVEEQQMKENATIKAIAEIMKPSKK